MTNYARIINDHAIDVYTDPEIRFSPELLEEFVEVPDDVVHGSRLENGTWIHPGQPGYDPEPEPTPE